MSEREAQITTTDVESIRAVLIAAVNNIAASDGLANQLLDQLSHNRTTPLRELPGAAKFAKCATETARLSDELAGIFGTTGEGFAELNLNEHGRVRRDRFIWLCALAANALGHRTADGLGGHGAPSACAAVMGRLGYSRPTPTSSTSTPSTSTTTPTPPSPNGSWNSLPSCGGMISTRFRRFKNGSATF